MEGKLTDAVIKGIEKEIEKVAKTVSNDFCSVKEDMKKLTSDTEKKIVDTVETKLEEGVKNLLLLRSWLNKLTVNL